jgi:hypothetical protein
VDAGGRLSSPCRARCFASMARPQRPPESRGNSRGTASESEPATAETAGTNTCQSWKACKPPNYHAGAGAAAPSQHELPSHPPGP